MQFARWNPWGDLALPHQDLDRVLRRASLGSADFRPTTDIHETAEAFKLSLDLPGVQLEDIEIEVTHRVLKISGERRAEQRTDKPGYQRLERTFGRFGRTFGLGDDIDDQNIVAKMQDGVLHLHLPKKPAVQPRKIAITN